MKESYLCIKAIDLSVFSEGFSIASSFHKKIIDCNPQLGIHGYSMDIRLQFENNIYPAKITNNAFDRKKYPAHRDILQIRYGKKTGLPVALQRVFWKSDRTIREIRKQRMPGDQRHIIIPEKQREYLVVYATEQPDLFVLEAINAEEMTTMRSIVQTQSELDFENRLISDFIDPEATIVERIAWQKMRKVNRKIGSGLKILYHNRCQICGQDIGEHYGIHISEAHHIEYFVRSLNNEASNQMIVCPNHHRIIHAVNPEFNWKKKVYVYPNGLEEGLLINYHL